MHPHWSPQGPEGAERTADGLRIIRTARDMDAVNDAVRHGLRPLFRHVERSPRIRSKYAIFRHRPTGRYEAWGDFRAGGAHYEQVTPFHWYHPQVHPSPFAAYLLPPDLLPLERVWLEDLIEDIVGSYWQQGDVWRLPSCEAIWTGDDLLLQLDPGRPEGEYIG